MTMPNGDVLVDSWAIAAASGLPPIDDAIKHVYDEELGPLARQFSYYFTLSRQNRQIWDGLCKHGQSFAFRTIWHLGFGSYVTRLLTKTFACDDDKAFADCRTKLVSLFERLAERLRDRKGGRFLAGDSPGVEDLALASLAAPVVRRSS